MRGFVLLSIVLIGSMHYCLAQSDFGLWLGSEVKYPVNKKLELSFEVQSRFESNVTRVSSSFLSPSVSYELHKFLEISAAYRLSNAPKETGFFGTETTHRLGIDLKSRNLMDLIKKKSRLQTTLRLRATHEMEGTDLNNDYFRGQLEFSYNLPKTKLKPSISGEFFYHFNDQFVYTFDAVESRSRINKCRIQAELKYPLSKRHDLKLFYFIEPEFESPDMDFVLGLNYTYNIKRKKD